MVYVSASGIVTMFDHVQDYDKLHDFFSVYNMLLSSDR